MQHNNLWKLTLAGVVLVFLAAIGAAHVAYPDWFIKRSGVRKGGEMLTEWNRLGFQIAGVIVASFAVYVLYHLLHG
jgi:hypothetical protein